MSPVRSGGRGPQRQTRRQVLRYGQHDDRAEARIPQAKPVTEERAVVRRPAWIRRASMSMSLVRVGGGRSVRRPPPAREGAPVRVGLVRGVGGFDEGQAQAVDAAPHAVKVRPAVLVVVGRVHAASAGDVGADGSAVQVGQSFHDLGEREPLLPLVVQPPRCVEHLFVDGFFAAGQGRWSGPCFVSPILQVGLSGLVGDAERAVEPVPAGEDGEIPGLRVDAGASTSPQA